MRRSSSRLVSVLFVLGLVLRVAWIARDPLWYDETFTAAVIEQPVGAAWQAILGDVHPPGWYAIEVVITGMLGARDAFAMRYAALLLSCLALTLYVLWCTDAGLAEPVQIVAVGLMALLPGQVRYAAEARMYAAVSLGGVLLLYGVTCRRRWLLAAGIALLPWMHHVGWLYAAAAIAAAVPWLRSDRSARRAVVIALAVAAPCAALALYQTVHGVSAGYWIADRSAAAWIYGATFAQWWGEGLLPSSMAWHGGLLAVGLALAGTVAGVRQGRRDVALLAWLPGLLLLAVSQVAPMLLPRAFIGSAPALFALSAMAVGPLLTSAPRLAIAGLALAPLIIAGQAQLASGIRMSMAPLLARTAGCDQVVHTGVGTLMVALYYAPDQEHLLWTDANSGLDDAISAETEAALGIRRAPLDAGCAVVYSDHVLVDDYERTELDRWRAGRRPTFVLADDELKTISLYR